MEVQGVGFWGSGLGVSLGFGGLCGVVHLFHVYDDDDDDAQPEDVQD